MIMSTSTDFKILEIPVDGVNSYIPPIVVNEADNNGRHLKFTPTYERQPVTGITSARMYYDPRPRDASSIGDYVDGTKDGDGWVFVLPPNTFTANVQGIASVSFTDADGETYTRSMPIYVESGGTKADNQGTRIDRLIAVLEQMVNDSTMTAEAETGKAGSQANVTVTKMNGGAYNLKFVIPRGDKGEQASVAHDGTLTGDGTGSNPLGAGIGSALNPYGVSGAVDANAVHDGVMAVTYNTANLPTGLTGVARGFIIGYHGGLGSPRFTQLLVSCAKGITPRIFARGSEYSTFDEWTEFATKEDIHDVSALTSRVAALDTKMNELAATQTRLQALEARVKSLETNQ